MYLVREKEKDSVRVRARVKEREKGAEHGCHLAFFETVCLTENNLAIWQFFGLF